MKGFAHSHKKLMSQINTQFLPLSSFGIQPVNISFIIKGPRGLTGASVVDNNGISKHLVNGETSIILVFSPLIIIISSTVIYLLLD